MRKIEIQDWITSGGKITLGQGVDNQGDPNGPFPFPIGRNSREQVLSIQSLLLLVRSNPSGNDFFDVFHMNFQASKKFGRYFLRQMPMSRQGLAGTKSSNSVGFGQVQFEKDTFGSCKGLLGILRNGIPNSNVGNVDGSKKVGGRIGFHSPQKTFLFFFSIDDTLTFTCLQCTKLKGVGILKKMGDKLTK